MRLRRSGIAIVGALAALLPGTVHAGPAEAVDGAWTGSALPKIAGSASFVMRAEFTPDAMGRHFTGTFSVGDPKNPSEYQAFGKILPSREFKATLVPTGNSGYILHLTGQVFPLRRPVAVIRGTYRSTSPNREQGRFVLNYVPVPDAPPPG